ncbi:MAG: sensor histidine kinase [Phycicoccus sp.]|nr:sensor histidine kinase [Phycicoccus sp.]
MNAVWRSLWREPRAADPPPVSRADWLLVGGFAAAALIEGVARPDLTGQPFVTVLAMALMPVLIWRRSRPLLTCLIGFGVAGLLSLIQIASHTTDLGLYAMMAILIVLYSLARWGSGQEIVLGMPCVAAVAALGLYAASAGVAEVVGGSLFLLLFVAVAAVFRYRADLWRRQAREVRNEERLALARELHDTVAHHVSAIAVQAQAGGVVASAQPQQAVAILAAIEAEASRTLAEMRGMVQVLREDGRTAFAPQLGVADLPALARPDATPTIEVRVAESMGQVPRPVDAAIYRVAQEALTNAVRHSHNATRVSVDVRRDGALVTVRVADDGLNVARPPAQHGFGLTGMAERAQLLGGMFSAGPAPEGGWVVEAVLPVEVPT